MADRADVATLVGAAGPAKAAATERGGLPFVDGRLSPFCGAGLVRIIIRLFRTGGFADDSFYEAATLLLGVKWALSAREIGVSALVMLRGAGRSGSGMGSPAIL